MSAEPTTLTLSSDLLAAVDKVVQEGLARNRDELVESAIRRQLAELRRSALDAEFQHMAGDLDYQSDVHRILKEFAQADLEAFHLEAPECPGGPRRRRLQPQQDREREEQEKAANGGFRTKHSVGLR